MFQVFRLLFQGFIFSSFLFGFAKAQEHIAAEHLEISLLAPEKFSLGKNTFGILFKPEEHWHVYWKNSGDSGAAPKFQFAVNGATVGETQWPFPARLPVAHLVNLGYEGQVAYGFPIDVTEPRVEGTVKLEWLVCREECIPGFGTLQFIRNADANAAIWEPQKRSLLENFLSKVPRSSELSGFEVQHLQWNSSSPEIKFSLQVKNVNQAPPDVFPVSGDFISPQAPHVTVHSNSVEYAFKRIEGVPLPNKTSFVVVSADKSESWEFNDVNLTEAKSQIRDESARSSNSEIWFLLLSAFVGGVLLNLMPCVFPVLSIKVFSLIRPVQGESENFVKRGQEGLRYTLGVLVTFLVLGLVFVLLRAGGAAVGWGFQLQNPVVILSLMTLFWLMALNFLGVFEFGTSAMNAAGTRAGKWSSSFGTGVLAVFVAAPCTGPFMGTALGAATTLPTTSSMLIFLSLGFGLALPFLLLTLQPKLLRFLPRPGKWMDTLKQFFAFPLFATVIWLLWVLGKQLGVEGVIAAALLLFLLSFAIWLAKSRRSLVKSVAWVLGIGAFLYATKVIGTVESASVGQAKEDSMWRTFLQSEIDEERAKGRAVFVDFTAAWCITCQVNKKVVLETEHVTKLFKENNVLTVRADWTVFDESITKALSAFGRNSVPLYVFYSANGGGPQVLPQILTTTMIEDLFHQQKETLK